MIISPPYKQIILTITVALLSVSATAQKLNWFTYEGNNAFIAEMYSPLTKMELVSLNKLHPLYYQEGDFKRPFIEVQTGFNLPVIAFQKNLKFGNFSTSLSLPVSLLTAVDFFERETAPVINTDYRFGTEILLQYSPNKSVHSFFKSYHFRLVPIFHESTHIGDEFSLHGYHQIPEFKRINVSYEAWKIFLGFNNIRNNQIGNLRAEIGYQRLMPYKVGYYDIDPLEVQGSEISLSKARDLWSLKAEYSYPLNFSHSNMHEVIASSALKREIKFGYTPENPEQWTWSVNFYFGYRIPIKHTPNQIGLYYRFYNGIVPYGQLRDEDGFSLHGLSLIIN